MNQQQFSTTIQCECNEPVTVSGYSSSGDEHILLTGTCKWCERKYEQPVAVLARASMTEDIPNTFYQGHREVYRGFKREYDNFAEDHCSGVYREVFLIEDEEYALIERMSDDQYHHTSTYNTHAHVRICHSEEEITQEPEKWNFEGSGVLRIITDPLDYDGLQDLILHSTPNGERPISLLHSYIYRRQDGTYFWIEVVYSKVPEPREIIDPDE